MARIKIELPESFALSTSQDVRITDLNYGAHVGNDTVLSFVHEARVRYLQSLGYSELNLAGVGLIMADAALIFKNEIYHGDKLLVSVQALEFSRVGFDLIYKLEKKATDQSMLLVAVVKTAMVCFDYQLRKVVPLPEEAALSLNKPKA